MIQGNKKRTLAKLLSLSLVVVLTGTGVWLGVSGKASGNLPETQTKQLAMTSAANITQETLDRSFNNTIPGEFEAKTPSFLWPVDSGYIRDGYLAYPGHMGIDIVSSHGIGDPVYACQAGTVTKVHKGYTGYGCYVEIDHGDGWKTLYAHLSEAFVSVGDIVDKGQEIATVGRTGRTPGPQLHLELIKDGKLLDAAEYLETPEE